MLDGLFMGWAAAAEAGERREEMASARATAVAAQARARAELLHMDVERLLMITEALWTLLKEQHGYTDDVLIRRIQQLDLRDGALDGRVAAAPPLKCPGCGRTLMRRHPRCLYCGAPVAVSPFDR
jgi:hypothetical protein